MLEISKASARLNVVYFVGLGLILCIEVSLCCVPNLYILESFSRIHVSQSCSAPGNEEEMVLCSLET